MQYNKKVVDTLQKSLEQSREEGLDEEDVMWIAVGAVNRIAREEGLVGLQLASEWNGAVMALVKAAMKEY